MSKLITSGRIAYSAHSGRHTAVRTAPCSRATRSLKVLAHGSGSSPHGHGGAASPTKEKAEKEKGFVNEMRMVAMKLHTREQAPKEGQQQAAPQPKAWTPTRAGYLRFLVESKAVYDVLEAAVQDKGHPEYASFCATGLERSSSLAADIEWFKETYKLAAPSVHPDGPGATYAKLIADLAKTDPQAFICHYYNFYFAHTAGGRMIGNKVGEMLLDSKQLSFYQWEGDVQALLDNVRRKINQLAEGWTAPQKEHCLAETLASFKYSGKIMECITSES